MEPLVSIVIPVYRTQAYLAMCMESVLGQTYQNLEIILVDDESPDDCPRLCEDYARQDTRVKVIHRKNGGLSAARNSGLEAAAGAYVTFLAKWQFIEISSCLFLSQDIVYCNNLASPKGIFHSSAFLFYTTFVFEVD